MKTLIAVITAIRNIRSAWNISPAADIRVFINTHDKKDSVLLEKNKGMISRLAKISEFKAGEISKPDAAAVSVVGSMEVYVPLGGVIDLKKERERLKKEETRVIGVIKSTEARLKDKNFVSKAPEDVVEKQGKQLAELKVQLAKLRSNMETI
jgi:valyl-tRNA synthetase